MEELLKSLGLKWEDLDTPGHAGERDELMNRLASLQKEPFTLEDLKNYIHTMRTWTEQQLTKKKEKIQGISLLVLFIPFLGIIRQWYQDQEELIMRARLANYIGLEEMLLSPERMKKRLESDLKEMAKSIQRGVSK